MSDTELLEKIVQNTEPKTYFQCNANREVAITSFF